MPEGGEAGAAIERGDGDENEQDRARQARAHDNEDGGDRRDRSSAAAPYHDSGEPRGHRNTIASADVQSDALYITATPRALAI